MREERYAVLVADSDADRRQHLADLLGLRYEVTSVTDPAAAVEKLKAGGFDLLLAAVDLTGEEPLGWLEQPRDFRETSSLPVVLLPPAEAADDSEFWQQCFQRGANDVLRLPLIDAEVQARVAAALQQADSALTDSRRLQKEQSRLQMALSAARMVATEWDLATDTLTVSDNSDELFGPLPSAVFESSEAALQLVHADDVQRLKNAVQAAISERSEYQIQYRVVRPDNGQIVWLEQYGYVVTDKVGRAVRLVAVSVDITTRRNAETAIQEREHYLQAIFDTTPECIKIVSADGRLKRMNAAGLQMIEASPNHRVVGHDVYQLIAPEDRDAFRRFNQQVCAGQGGVLQFDIVGLQGSRRNMETHAVPLQMADGETVQLAITRDVSQRRRAEAALRESEQRFRNLADRAPTMLWITDVDGQCTMLTQGWYDFTGQAADEGLGEGWLKAIHPEDREKAGRIFRTASEQREAFSIDYRLRRKDGEYRMALDTGRPLFDGDGQFEGFIGSVIDVHQRWLAEEFRAAQTRILKMITSEEPLSEVLTELVRYLEARIPGCRGSILLADDDGKKLLFGAAPRLPVEYNLAVDGVPIGPDIGSCGTAAYLRKPVVVTEIATDPKWADFRDLAADHGLQSCWSVPIMSSDDVLLGTFAIYFDAPHPASSEELDALKELAEFASIAIGRPRAQAALRDSERRFRALTSATSDVVYRLNADWTLMRQLDGRGLIADTTQPSADWLQTYVPVEDRDRVLEAIEHAQDDDSVFELEHRVNRLDGSLGWVHSRAVPIFDDAGRLVEWFGAATDVTRRKQAEQLQQRITRTLATVIEQSPLGIYLVDSQFKIAQVSLGAMPAFRNVQPVLGRDFEEVMHTLWPHEFADEAIRIFRQTLETGVPYVSPGLTETRKDLGAIESYEWQVNRVTLADGSYGVVCYFFDTTRLQQAANALRESEERFRMLADNMSQLAWTCEELCQVNWYNRRWYEYTGSTSAQMQGEGWKQVHHPDHVDRIVKSIDEARESGTVWEDTFPLRGQDGQYRWFLSRAVPIRDEHGKIVRWFGTNTDVTELRETQQLLREADRRKDEFLAMLAHELRNPLAPIRSGLDILSLAQDLEHADVVRVMQEQVTHVVRLVDDLLDMSRILRGKVELRKERIPLQPTVQKAIDAVEGTIREHGHELSVELPNEPVWLDADPVRIVQVLENLLNNATKYMDGDGVIEFAARVDGERLSIEVRDEGIGIEPDFLPKVFELFAQSDKSLDRSKGGLGIGLTLVRQLIEMHGGEVSVQSDGRNCGSCFRVALPIAEPPDDVESDSEDADLQSHPRRIVVVDDNRGAAMLLTRLLQKLGDHTIHAAHDGTAALELIREHQPEIVLLDIGLPGLSGYDVASELRQDSQFDDLLLIALTGYGQAQDRIRSREVGFDEHLVKPPSIDQMKFVLSHPKLRRPAASDA